MTNLLNTTLGQYQIVALLGEGGMATVYKAWQPSLRRYVALKVLAPHLSHDAEFVQRFHQEAVSAANLRHSSIVTIHDVGTESGYHYIAMESIEGASLQKRIRSGQTFTPQQVADVISQIGSALDYAHQRGFIHRDIKPANILVDPSGRAVLTDFGIVKALSGSGLTAALTQAGTIIGTPHYMSPEQVKDEPLDHRSDLYSLGIVCYEMLAGQVPFGGNTTHAILYAQVNTPPPPLRQALGPAVPPAVEAVVGKMLAKEREKRYNSGGEFARDLAQAVSGVRPAGVGGEAQDGRRAAADTELIGRTPGGVEVPTMGQPVGAPTVAEVIQPLELPALPPVPAPARRSRWSLLLVGAAAAGVVLIVGAVLAAVIFLGGGDSLEDMLADAQAALAAGDHAQAVEGFSQVLEHDPDNVEAIEGLLEAADNLAQAGQFDGAIAAYETVRQVKPGEIQALRGLGQAYEAQREWGEAAVWYEKWTQAVPADGSASLALGYAHFNLGEYERAVADYERAAALGASSAEMDAHLGLAYFELTQYDKAVEHLQNAVGQNPEGIEEFQLQRALGLSLYAQDQHAQAAEHLNKAVALGAGRPGDELMDVYYVLGGCYFRQQDYAQAISFYEQAQELDPEGKAVWAEEARANLDQAYVENAMKDVILNLDFSNIVTEEDGTYAIAKTGQKTRIEGPVRIVNGLWEGSQALVVEEGTTNCVYDPIFGYGDMTQYDTTGTSPPARSTSRYLFGSASAKFDLSATPDEYALRKIHTTSDGGYWTASAYIYIDSYSAGYARVQCGVHYDDGTSDYAVANADTSLLGRWQRVVATQQANNEKTVSEVRIYVYSPSGATVAYYADGIQLENKAYATSVCYGSAGSGYSWSGAAYASTSTRTETKLEMDADDASFDYSSDHTVLVWMQVLHDAGNRPTYSAAFHYGDWISANSITVLFDSASGALIMYTRGNDGVQQERNKMSKPGGGNFAKGEWYLVGYSYDASENQVSLIWNGEIDASSYRTAWPSANNTSHKIGILTRPGGGQQGGMVTEFAVFDRVLTAVAVAALNKVDMPVSR